MLPVSTIAAVGGYDEFFAIDGLDIEFCLRARQKGILFCLRRINCGSCGRYFQVYLRGYYINVFTGSQRYMPGI